MAEVDTGEGAFAAEKGQQTVLGGRWRDVEGWKGRVPCNGDLETHRPRAASWQPQQGRYQLGVEGWRAGSLHPEEKLAASWALCQGGPVTAPNRPVSNGPAILE